MGGLEVVDHKQKKIVQSAYVVSSAATKEVVTCVASKRVVM